MTLMDRFDYIATKYIRRTKKEIQQTSEDLLNAPKQYEGKPNAQLTSEECREYGLTSSTFIKGTIKKNSDTFRAWFKLKREDGTKMTDDEKKIIKGFEKRSEIRKKFKVAGICADIWGDGYLLIKFANEPSGFGKLKTEIPVGAEPVDLIWLNPENIPEMYYPYGEPKNGEFKQIYYHYKNIKKDEDFPIHPDRLLHIKTFELPNSPFGISKVQVLKNILKSAEDIDVATGEILKWFSHGIQILTKQNMTKAEKEKAVELMQTHPNFFAFSDKYTFDIKNPTAINPTPFYEHTIQAIADALIMPKHVLQGIVVGRVTGAEVGWADYYRDIRDNQDLVYTPLIERLYKLLGDAYSKDFEKYEIVWETTYIDELAEAEILGKKVAAAVNARAGNKPLITIKEARRIINEGNIELDPEEIPEEEQEPTSQVSSDGKTPEKNETPNNQERLVKPVTKEHLENYQKEMIENYKALQEIIKKERKLGEEILKEQDEIDKNA